MGTKEGGQLSHTPDKPTMWIMFTDCRSMFSTDWRGKGEHNPSVSSEESNGSDRGAVNENGMHDNSMIESGSWKQIFTVSDTLDGVERTVQWESWQRLSSDYVKSGTV